jgi:N-acyl-D-amino-acid deacylase
MRPLLFLIAATSLCAADYDLLISNARVVDGTGNPWFRANVAIKDGRIAAIGKLPNATADRTIDARERIVAPGFIDVHTHIEGAVEKVPRGDNYLLDGVTTVITGNCGGSTLNLTEWFERLGKLGLGLNVGTLIGHNTVRREVMGTENRLATPDEIARMQALVERAMQEGAVGFSTGLIYIPGTYSNTAEVVALAQAAAKYGGTYASHMRDEGEQVIEAITEAVTVGKETGMPVQLSHFKIDNRRLWGSSDMSIALVQRFRREGVDVVVDQYPYDRSSTNLGIVLPSWALAGGAEQIKERLTNPEVRAQVVAETEAKLRSLGHPDYSYATIASYRTNPEFNGKTISEMNALLGRPRTVRSEIETVFEILLNGGAQMVYHSMSNADVERILRFPFTAIASDGGIREFGDGVPHPRSYGTNARVLAEFVRNRPVLTLEDAIRRMTTLPARTFNLRERGILREGAAADIVIFDPARVQDKATYQEPHQYSEGFDFVLVNGQVAVEDGKLTETRAGKPILRATH